MLPIPIHKTPSREFSFYDATNFKKARNLSKKKNEGLIFCFVSYDFIWLR
jgi:hypothetical protein